MLKYVLIAAVVFGIFFYHKSCAPSRAKDRPFTAEWSQENLEGISETKETQRMTILTDGKKFRIDAQVRQEIYAMGPQDSKYTVVYDGETLYKKSVYVPDPASGREPEESPATASRLTEDQAALQRFWQRHYLGQAGPGGQIAGRDTLLYQARENRPEGEITVQAWVDKETGTVLKSVETIFSTQVDSIVSKITSECRSIQYGPVDDGHFKKL